MGAPNIPRGLNVVWIVTDQQRYDSLGCCGNPYAVTPHLDALARAGTVCHRFYTTNAVCMPSRASLLTGLHVSAHGVWNNGVPLARRGYVHETSSAGGGLRPGQAAMSELPTVADRLAGAGYRTASIGKLHLTPTQGHPSLGHQECRVLWEEFGHFQNWHGPYYGFQYVEMSLGHGEHQSGHYGEWVRRCFPDVPGRVSENQRTAPHPCSFPRQIHAGVLPVEAHHSTWCGERAAAYIREASRETQPFFLWVGFPDPHHPMTPPAELVREFERHDFLPSACPEGEWPDKPRALRSYMRPGGGWYCEPGGVRPVRQYIDAMVHLIDRGVGRILDALRETGQWERTLILFTSDHGDYLGDFGLVYKTSHACRCLHHVPLVLRFPEGEVRGEVRTALSAVDLAPTIFRAAGLAAPADCQGEALQDVACGGRRLPVLGQNFPHDPEQRNLTVWDERFRYTWYPGTEETELYDHTEDPHELRNVAREAGYTEEGRRLHQALLEASARSVVPQSGRVAIW